MSLYHNAKAFKLPESKAKCTYCSTEYMCAEGPYSICPLCESMVIPGEKSSTDPAVASKLGSISRSIAKGAYLEAIESAEQLCTNADPKVLYALASLYRSLSDITYMDVDYTMKAFMERNADNRNDEIKRNKYNAMHLESRNRECLHKSIETLELSKAEDENSLFIKAMAEIKLKRYAHASIILENKPGTTLAFKYAKMVLATESNDKDAEKKINEMLHARETSAIFYAAKYLAMRKEFVSAEKLIDIISSLIDIPKYKIYGKRIKNVAGAAGI
ncbi:MAG: hypothetical protein M1520_00180 [Candidatus Marsarchaeota archaeon]|jgi:hypothetical protein|nr:hypothetical protein [Candidatus Marsarchaeota archaeon]